MEPVSFKRKEIQIDGHEPAVPFEAFASDHIAFDILDYPAEGWAIPEVLQLAAA